MEHNIISIVIPVYNASQYLPIILCSVICQTYRNWELILINDGSTDDCQEIIDTAILKDKRIKSFYQNNAGVSRARNKGVQLAQGEYITFIDADDNITKNYLEKLIYPFLRFDIQLSCAGYFEQNRYNPEGIPLHDFRKYFPSQIINRKQFQSNIFEGLTGVLWSKMFKTDILKHNDITLNTKVKFSEDLLVVLEYSKYCQSVAIVQEYIYYYNRINENGLSGRFNFSFFKDLQYTNDRIIELTKDIDIIDTRLVVERRSLNNIIKIIKDSTSSNNDFNEICNFTLQEYREILGSKLVSNQFDRLILNLVLRKKNSIAKTIIRIYKFIRRIKHV